MIEAKVSLLYRAPKSSHWNVIDSRTDSVTAEATHLKTMISLYADIQYRHRYPRTALFAIRVEYNGENANPTNHIDLPNFE